MDVSFLGLFVLLSVAGCSAEQGVRRAMKAAAGSQSVTLQPWLVGLSAVVGFLFIVFTILIVRRLLKNRKVTDGWEYNKTLELEGGNTKQTSL
ncbi:uncharacterized protein [Paralichthys olivaceus]|uniref:uncharacterized protein n=1 Tax=Paralichthys olivaceus TaxID=8255 RepID=UPI00097D4805|nr:PREDICTED: small integral membrane protein 24 [Paralichthys olivaceus]